jgi:hypothetical protein
MNRKAAPIPESIVQVQHRLEQHRNSQPRRGKLPESLWQAATELARQHGVHAVAHPLGLDYMRLKQRLLAVTGQPKDRPAMAFVELISPAASKLEEWVVEFESPRGGKMRIRCGASTSPDWSSLLPDGVEILVAHCLAHGRRRVVEVAQSFPEPCRYVLERLGEVYRNDSEARDRGLTAQERLRLHQERSSPVMEKLHGWLEAPFACRERYLPAIASPNSSTTACECWQYPHGREASSYRMYWSGTPARLISVLLRILYY